VDCAELAKELGDLVHDACSAWSQKADKSSVIHRICLWIDPAGPVAGISVETASHARVGLLADSRFLKRLGKMSAGNAELSAAIGRADTSKRYDPGDYEFSPLVKRDLPCLEGDWSDTDWHRLMPILRAVQQDVGKAFADFPATKDAEIGISTFDQWFAEPLALSGMRSQET
jgi:hypothetical protein